ncbi:MAG: YqjF family protein [Pirellulales bacterium]
MRWHDLLFAHWPVDAAQLRPHIPAALEIDTFAGQAWIGIVPFRMTGVRPRLSPSLPGFSAFPELNVRTYVSAEGKPGVWFLSLDATCRSAVRLARWTWHLPYFDANISFGERDGWIDYRSRRAHRGAPAAEFAARFRPIGPARPVEPATLEAWLIERYCLYAASTKRVFRGDVHHVPWPIQPAEAEIECNTMTAPFDIVLPDRTPLLHFARVLDTVAWAPRRVRAADRLAIR